MPRSTRTNPTPPQENAAEASSPNDDGTSNTHNNHLLRTQIDSLHQEMQVAQYGVDVTGYNLTRKLSRKQRVVKNQQRKTLEQQDYMEQQALQQQLPQPPTKRFRTLRASMDDEIIQGSLVVGVQ